jgi:biopolymer transport protein ExbD
VKEEQETDLDMVPIMNMFLVLIPFLLMSASFLHLKAINTSVPVQAERHTQAEASEPKVEVTLVIEIRTQGFHISALSDALDGRELAKLGTDIPIGEEGAYGFAQMADHLETVKNRYPASNTMLVIPEPAILYDTIIQTMDAARYSDNQDLLFPNVVLSGKVG